MTGAGVLWLPELDCPTPSGLVRSQQPWYLAANQPGFHVRMGPVQRRRREKAAVQETIQPKVAACVAPAKLTVLTPTTRGCDAPAAAAGVNVPKRRDRKEIARGPQGPTQSPQYDPHDDEGWEGLTVEQAEERLAARQRETAAALAKEAKVKPIAPVDEAWE